MNLLSVVCEVQKIVKDPLERSKIPKDPANLENFLISHDPTPRNDKYSFAYIRGTNNTTVRIVHSGAER